MMNVEAFKANMYMGIAKPNRYDVLISSPTRGFSPEIGMVAEEAMLPGKSLATRTMGLYGPTRKNPYQEVNTDLQITFICSSDMWERKWVEEWMRKVVNPKSGYFGYYNDYISQIIIRQQDELGFTTYEGVATE
mgnify:CR=1 FL=1